MKTITFPVGYRPGYLSEFLTCLENQDLNDYTIVASAEKCPKCIEILEDSPLDITVLVNQKSSGTKSHSGARINMYNALSYAFASLKTDFNVHLEDDFLLSPDALNLANWYYNNFKDKPESYISYGFFGFNPRGDDYSAIEEVTFFEGLGWCTFKENWYKCFSRCWFDDTLAREYFNAYGWDWAVQAYFRKYRGKALRPLINRTQHNGRFDGTCCTVEHHDKHYTPLKWNKTEKVTEFRIIGDSDTTKEWIK
jgi:hypothetical protein